MIAWPAVAQALVALMPTLPGWDGVPVFDGPPVTADVPQQYAIVGYVSDEQAGTFTQTLAMDGVLMDENGNVRCRITCQTGDDDLPGVRAEAFGLVNELQAALRAGPLMYPAPNQSPGMDQLSTSGAPDHTLGGVLSANATCELAGVVESIKADAGTAFTVVVDVHYYTLTR